MRHADFYERDCEVFFLRDILKASATDKVRNGKSGAPYLRLKLSSGHLFHCYRVTQSFR